MHQIYSWVNNNYLGIVMLKENCFKNGSVFNGKLWELLTLGRARAEMFRPCSCHPQPQGGESQTATLSLARDGFFHLKKNDFFL